MGVIFPLSVAPAANGPSKRTPNHRPNSAASLINCNGFRNPCLTAKMAATVDHASNGRFILGLGAGWFELEDRSLGFEFKPIAQRLEALDEACTIVTSMLERGKASFRGRHYAVADAMCSPRAVQIPRPPLMIAGRGEKVMLGIVALHADLWNAQGSPDRFRHLIDRLRGQCDRNGRDPDAIEKSVTIAACYRQGREREEEALRFAAMLGRTSPEEARRQMMIGTREECLDRIEEYLAAGVTHFILVSGGRFQIDEIRAFAAEVIAAVRA